MSKITESKLHEINEKFKDNGGILAAVESKSNFTGFTSYDIRIKPNPYIDVEYHPINVTKECIQMIEEVLSDFAVTWNNSRTSFWINGER